MQQDKNSRIGIAEFKEINWLNINDRFSKCVLSSIYKFFNSESPEYFNEIYFPADPSNINTRSSFFIFQKGTQWKYSFLAFLRYPSDHNFYKIYLHFSCCKFVVGELDLPTYLPTYLMLQI